MDRFKINCEISNKPAELQLDLKKFPDEVGPCFMVSVDGVFKGYIKNTKTDLFEQLGGSHFTDKDMLAINKELLKFKLKKN